MIAVRTPTGSSPRARGTREVRAGDRGAARFIPACAGNTSTPSRTRSRSPVHPRVRGEHDQRQHQQRVVGGSSPRARGTRSEPATRPALARFIPACAGNTSSNVKNTAPNPVHPRVRGEHRAYDDGIAAAAGSSPRARGTRHRRLQRRHLGRFIPACAGNTSSQSSSSPTTPVHPRVRGEHSAAELLLLPKIRFIPACAGNTR